jgi:hypothetical protein
MLIKRRFAESLSNMLVIVLSDADIDIQSQALIENLGSTH